MSKDGKSRYPADLARLVIARLKHRNIPPPPTTVLMQFIETLYFASLKTDERRPCRCTVNLLDPQAAASEEHSGGDVKSAIIRFRQITPFNVRSLNKLSEAADPAVSSMAVSFDENNQLWIYGLVDQEIQAIDHARLEIGSQRERPGVFQAKITETGCISIYKDDALLGCLEQDNLIASFHDVLWQGPVHQRLKANLEATFVEDRATSKLFDRRSVSKIKGALLIRWQNGICRLLHCIQQYGHGGGLLITPRIPTSDVNIKHQIRYDRLPQALFGLAKHQLLEQEVAHDIAQHCQLDADVIPCVVHQNAMEYKRKLFEHRTEALGCVRFIASLSRVDGFVLLDKNLVVHGFGVEARSDCELTDVYTATDAKATPRLLRQTPLSQYGTRHRSMMRYCDSNEDALGFVISQDGDIRATMKVNGRLILWENINIQIGLRTEGTVEQLENRTPMSSLFQDWGRAMAQLHSA